MPPVAPVATTTLPGTKAAAAVKAMVEKVEELAGGA
jgi:hypothetical protein